jgi:general secretion pathway protein D
MTRSALVLLTCAALAPIAVLAHAQQGPTRSGPINAPGAVGGLGAAAGTAAGTSTTPPTTATARPTIGATPGATGTGTAAAPSAGAAKSGPGGKAMGDTDKLPQFQDTMEFTPRPPNFRVAFSLEDADLPELVKVIGQITGRRFIFGGKVRQIKATVYCPEKVTVAEAYQAFLSILETNGLTVVPHGRFLKIVETPGIAAQTTPVTNVGQPATQEDRYITRLHRLSHVSADEVANVLNKFKTKEGDITVYGPSNLLIITDTGTNIRRMMQIVEDIDVGGAGDQIWIEPIHYASATDVANRVNELFDVKGGGGGGGAPAAKGSTVVGAAAGGSGSGDMHIAKIVADDRSNSVVIVSTERAYLRVLELIKRIDVPQSGEGEIHVLALQHADAVELQKTLNEIITGAAQAGQPPPGGRPGQAPAGGAPTGVFEGGIKVSADKATNSLVITSSLRDYASLRAVVDRLDQPRRQVFIEAVIMDLQLKRSDALGVSFHGGAPFETKAPDDSLVYGGNKITNTISPIPTDPDALQGFALGVRGPGINGSQNSLIPGVSIPAFGALISAIARTGDTDLLSTPHILATDNIAAEISVGDNIPLNTNLAGIGGLPITGTSTTATGAAGAAALGGLAGLGGLGSFSPQRQDVGTKIKIIPHLNESNEVRLELTEEISEAGAALGGSAGAIPISKRTANTTLVVRDQQTVVIGGLIRNVNTRAEDKVPVLGDIPVLGALFRKRTNTQEKRNLVLVLTPYIIRSQEDLRTVFERKMQERQEYLDRYFVFADSAEWKPPKDYSRMNGLVEDIRQAAFRVEEQRKLDELTRPREVKGHQPGQPIEMPAGGRSTGLPPPPGPAPAPTPNPPPHTGPGVTTPPINVNPAVRNIERIEK